MKPPPPLPPRNNVLAVIAGIFQIGGLFCFSVLLFFIFTEKKLTILLLLNFHPKTKGWPRMVDSAL
jgi:hypothetical protein